MYQVQVAAIDGWTDHSEHASYRDAVDQADMIHGRVVTPVGATDREAWERAVAEQGYLGTFGEWQRQDDEERAEYEDGASGVGTV